MEINEQKKFIASQEEKMFYNQSISIADFNYWIKFETFTIDQLVALSLGKNPEHVNLEKISRMPDMYSFAKEYKNRYALISNSFCGYLTLCEFIEWALKKEISLPEELIEWSNRKNEAKNEKNPNNKNIELHPRSETTYQNLVAGLLDFIEGKIPGIEKHPSYVSDNKLIAAISTYYSGIAGLTQSTLSHKIPECRRSLEESSN
jgi:hypothetical protein